jgi:dTDP-4-dehydrorhamnose reductase
VKDLENYNNYNILVTGGSGQIGSELKYLEKKSNFNFLFPSSSEFDLLDFASIENYFNSNKLNLVINLAAYTDVENSEIEKNKANIINNLAVKKISQETKKRNIILIHSSTDYVFGKENNAPYAAYDKKQPINYYGYTKSMGEEAALKENHRSIIIRFASVYSKYGRNFIKTIIKKLINEPVVKVVSDQKISLTHALDFSRNIYSLIRFCQNLNFENEKRIYHFVSKEYATWFSVAEIIFDEINNINKGFLKSELIPISSDEWNSKVNRPKDTRLKIDDSFYKENNMIVSSLEISIRSVVKEVFLEILNNELKNDY